jgi:hypothetical protein
VIPEHHRIALVIRQPNKSAQTLRRGALDALAASRGLFYLLKTPKTAKSLEF